MEHNQKTRQTDSLIAPCLKLYCKNDFESSMFILSLEIFFENVMPTNVKKNNDTNYDQLWHFRIRYNSDNHQNEIKHFNTTE